MKIKLSRLKNKPAHKSMNPWDYSDEAKPEDGHCGACKKFADIPGVNCIYCDKCSFWFHGTCIGIPNDDIESLSSPFVKWICPTCQQPELPDDTQIIDSLSSDFIICKHCPDGKKKCKGIRGLRQHYNHAHPESIQELSQPPPKSNTSFREKIGALKSSTRVVKRIPQGVRKLAATKLSGLIDACTEKNDSISWENLLSFAFHGFQAPPQQKNIKHTSYIRSNLNNWNPPPDVKAKFKPSSAEKRAEAKLADFDTRGAVKILSSDDTLAEMNGTTYTKLVEKHPSPSRELHFPEPPIDVDSLTVRPDDVKRAIFSFPNGSAAGVDGLLPQHLKDLISVSLGEAGTKTLTSLTKLCNLMLSGDVNPSVCEILYGASLCALKKKDGGIRPIAVGSVLRRLAAKLACFSVRESVGDYLRPKQVGFSTKGGCEAAIHATRAYISTANNMDKVLLKIDFKNAFNSVERDSILQQVKEKTPALFSFMNQCYRQPSLLFFGDKTISSQVGAQQGDPTGPMAFSLAIQPLIDSLLSDLNIWYLDDGTLCDKPEIVLKDFETLMKGAKQLGLEINPNKCELYFCSNQINYNTLASFERIAPGIRVVTSHELNLLGAPILLDGFVTHVEKQLEVLNNMLSKLPKLRAHYAYFLLKNCFGIPKLTYIMRTFPMWKFPEFVERMDATIQNAMNNIFNTKLEKKQWTQASLPIRVGGMGIRKVQDVMLPAFLSSAFSVQDLVGKILNKSNDEFQIQYLDEALEIWDVLNNNIKPSVMHFQNNWDDINTMRLVEEEMIFDSPIDTARFLALQKPESGSWLKATPSPNVGTFLQDQTFRVCVGLRLGTKICRPHTCHCGIQVDEEGRHGLSCKKSSGRFSRHSELNNIIQRALTSIHVPSTLEPVGLFRDDGKRPDGMTFIPWSKGKYLIWDATCVDTLATSYLEASSVQAGAAAEIASKRKVSKYQSLAQNNYFVPIAVETFGPWSSEAKCLVDTIGSQLILQTGDSRSRNFLYQRISLAIQRGNAISVMGTLPSSSPMEEVFYL